MRKTICFLLIVFYFLDLRAQTHRIEGKILSTGDVTGLERALIILPDLNKSATANEHAEFVFNSIPGNSQQIIITCAGYKPFSTRIFLTDSVQQFLFYLEPGNHELEEVIIVGTQAQTEDGSVTVISSISQRSLRSKGALSISDGVAKLPGVTQLSTGAGISKPVIRGLYGNRIQTVVMGLRFDNQQWQDEHGLGLSDIGIDRVEVLKGPAALMYGSEAMGGVINVIEERPVDVDSIRADASMRFYSNTFGASTDAGVRSSHAHYNWRIRAGYESQADYSDGNNERVLNSRFDGLVAKGTFGFDHKNWVSVNNYIFSKSDFGFIMDTASFMEADGRLGRKFENPHHTVFINLFTTQNTFFCNNGDIMRVIGGAHINRRMEDEGGGGISLDMQLITGAVHFQHEHWFGEKWQMTNGLQSQYQNNKNLGWRIIVPDADLAEASLYSYNKIALGDSGNVKLEFGIRYDLRYIKTDSLHNNAVVAPPPEYLKNINRTYNTINGSAGTSIRIVDDLHFKATITSGYRTPNLAELESNGVHEGTLRYEIGDPDMTIEQNFCAEAGLNYDSKHFSFSVTGYNNRFLNYIYLIPTSGDYFGFSIYRYIQTNATLQGGEATLDLSPFKEGWLDISSSYSFIRAKTDAGNYLPFIPSDKAEASLKFELGDKGKWDDIYFRTGGSYNFAQNHPAQFETATPGYFLLDAGVGTTVKMNHGKMMSIDLCGNNLLNEKYFDHLSRFKEFNIYNIGRNICLNLKYEW